MDRKSSVAMLTTIQSVGVTPKVNHRNSLYAGNRASKRGIHPDFETQERYHQKSKTGVSVAPRKGLVSPRFFFKKKGVTPPLMLLQTISVVVKMITLAFGRLNCYLYLTVKNRFGPEYINFFVHIFNCCSPKIY